MATVLSYPGWLGIKGIISTKIFDYIASGNPILIGPGDEDVIDELVKKTNTGISVYNAKDFAANLNKLYDLWTKKLPLNPSRNEKEVEFYSRENQARLLAKIINQL